MGIGTGLAMAISFLVPAPWWWLIAGLVMLEVAAVAWIDTRNDPKWQRRRIERWHSRRTRDDR